MLFANRQLNLDHLISGNVARLRGTGLQVFGHYSVSGTEKSEKLGAISGSIERFIGDVSLDLCF